MRAATPRSPVRLLISRAITPHRASMRHSARPHRQTGRLRLTGCEGRAGAVAGGDLAGRSGIRQEWVMPPPPETVYLPFESGPYRMAMALTTVPEGAWF